MSAPFVSAVIVAAGSGSRFGQDKLSCELMGKSVLRRSIEVFERADCISEIIVVTRAESVEEVSGLVSQWGLPKLTAVVAGGETRQQSVLCGLAYVSPECELIAVHDAARPLIREEEIAAVVAAVGEFDGAVLCVPVKDTIKEGSASGVIKRTPNRQELYAAQTPQAFKITRYRSACQRMLEKSAPVTDDSSLMELYGARITTVIGSYDNLKITTPEDLLLARAILEERENKVK